MFGGTASNDGVPAPNGTVVTAWIYDKVVASTTVSAGGYGFSIAQLPSETFAGKTIAFKVGNVRASQTAIWQDSGGGVLNLTAGTAPTPEPLPQIIDSNAIGYSKYVGLLTWDYTVAITIRVVNSGAAGSVAATATVQWGGQSKTKSETTYMAAGEEREFVFEFQKVASTDIWSWSADVR